MLGQETSGDVRRLRGRKWQSGKTKGPGGSEVCGSLGTSEHELGAWEVVTGVLGCMKLTLGERYSYW